MTSVAVQIVLVLYNIDLEDSETYLSFCQNKDSLTISYHLIVYNNSRDRCVKQGDWYEVINAEQNDMLYGAYNYALNKAHKNNTSWLMLLDQDTKLSDSYFKSLSVALSQDFIHDYVAIVPILKMGSRHLSPATYKKNLGPFWCNRPICDTKYTENEIVSAFNTTSVICVDDLINIGGFTSLYPLDMLDFWYFYQFYLQNKKVYVLDVVLQHSLSLLEKNNGMSIIRYKNFLVAELRFAKSISIITLLSYKMRLFLRLISQIIHKSKRDYSKETYVHLLYRW
jgi:hypothetical protein